MEEALGSVLCEPRHWTWEPFVNYCFKFNKDGTGELFCIQELTYLFALNLKWKILPSAQTGKSKAQLLGTFNLQITLQKGLAEGLSTKDPSLCLSCHETYLKESAYHPKTFNVTMEKGNFKPVTRVGYPEDKIMPLRYGLRLLFDRSPFPAYEDWNTGSCPPCGPADREQEPMLEFVGRQLEKEECGGRAMNDTASWGSCVVS